MIKPRALLAALALTLTATAALGQAGVPYFPQTLPTNTVVGRLSSGTGPTEAVTLTQLLNALFPGGSAAFPFNAASVVYQGSVSGAVTVKGQAAAGTYTFQWPSTVGTSGSCLSETVSGSTITGAWSSCALLGSNNTFTGTQTYSANAAFNGLLQWHGVTQTFPTSGNLVGTSDTQTLTNKSIDGSEINSGTVAAARGGAGTITGALKGNGSGTVSQAACADMSDAAASCATNALNASNISSGTLAAARGGAGTVSGVLSGNGSGTVSQGAMSGISDYAVGTFTPSDGSGAGLTFTSVSGVYTRIGNMVFAQGSVTYPATASGATATLQGLPFALPSNANGRVGAIVYSNVGGLVHGLGTSGASSFLLLNSSNSSVTNATMSGGVVIFEYIYPLQ